MRMIIREERIEDYTQTEHMTMRAFWNIHGPGCNEHLLVHKLRQSKDYLPDLRQFREDFTRQRYLNNVRMRRKFYDLRSGFRFIRN